MDVHSGDKAYTNELLLNCLIEHTLYTIRQVLLFMPDSAQDALVKTVADYKGMIQTTRLKKSNAKQVLTSPADLP